MGAAAPPIGHRVDLVGGEPAEQQQREGHPDTHPDQHIGRGVHAQRHPGQGNQDNQPGHHPLAEITPAPLRHQRVQHRHQARGQVGDLHRRHRPATPTGLELHPERARPPTDHAQAKGEEAPELHDDQPDQQVPPAPQDQQHQQQPVGQRPQHPPGGDAGQAPQRPNQPRPDQAGQPAHHRIIHHGDRHRRAPQSPGEHDQGQPDQHQRRHQPADPAGLQPIRQRRGRPGGRRRRRGDRTASGCTGRALVGLERSAGRSMGPPYRRHLPPGTTTLFAGFWVVKAQDTPCDQPAATSHRHGSLSSKPHLSVEALASPW